MTEMSEMHKDQLIGVLMHYCDQDTRGKLMAEVPSAYNAYCGREVVEVRVTSDARKVPGVIQPGDYNWTPR